MKEDRSKQLVKWFAVAMMTVPAVGCGVDADSYVVLDGTQEIELCYDEDRNLRCDDDGSLYDPSSYLVIDGKRIAYVKYADVDYDGSSG
jgi:hypothetical protein